MRVPATILGCILAVACSGESAPEAGEPALSDTMATASPAPAPEPDALPADIENVIRTQYSDDTHYLDGSIDLNGDGRPEIVVHLVGPMACGTGGCPTLVFTPTESGYGLVSTISVTRPPIRASTTSTNGWRNLIVRIGGGGGASGDMELGSDGRGYPGNPTVQGGRVQPASGEDSEEIIGEFDSFEETKALP